MGTEERAAGRGTRRWAMICSIALLTGVDESHPSSLTCKVISVDAEKGEIIAVRSPIIGLRPEVIFKVDRDTKLWSWHRFDITLADVGEYLKAERVVTVVVEYEPVDLKTSDNRPNYRAITARFFVANKDKDKDKDKEGKKNP